MYDADAIAPHQSEDNNKNEQTTTTQTNTHTTQWFPFVGFKFYAMLLQGPQN